MALSEVLRVHAGAARLFDDVGIDYACAGGSTVKAAAAAAGLTANELVALIAAARNSGERDWNEEPLSALTRHLTLDHQRLLRGLVPRVRSGIDAAIECHGQLSLLHRLRELTDSLAAHIAEHAASEERELFPIVERLEAAASTPGVEAPHTRISARVLREFLEHENVRDRVHTLRDLTADLLLDCDVRVLAAHLRELHHHLNQHIHLENNVLYPRAIAIENGLRHSAGSLARN
jgi:regulator of cell morphogenesis and NO signaling